VPLREKGEKLSHFVGRFMKSKHEKRLFPETKQRVAVAYSEARSKKHQQRGR